MGGGSFYHCGQLAARTECAPCAGRRTEVETRDRDANAERVGKPAVDEGPRERTDTMHTNIAHSLGKQR